MRVLTFCLGLMVIGVWANITSLLGHPGTWQIWLAFVSWLLLGAGVCVAQLIRWLASKARAGALGGLDRAGAGAPSILKGDK